ncbi:glutathione synthase [Aurantiacibacter rhizosphaerae]|uniref:Glutathione synthetase n=1 Tax=Aurantiacibacter rhizosphaerae TaxID=2691582 RepID=A0A844XEJ3_9SPHN|nr:glutathione synthase [Aurantiacibacter rhizosphaerae]MWV27998.1 glutathione synthase [Aurantiacibacter rhizosphaerae]
MSLRVAVQMDPIESIKIAGDSSFALMLEAQARGHSLWHYDVTTLAWEEGRITAWAKPVTVQRVEGDHFSAGALAKIDLADDIDVILMRQDPPFDLGYISAALLLDRLKGRTLVSNDPREVINAPEKMFVLNYAEFMPPTLIARKLEDVQEFQRKHGAVVVKPLHGNGGKAIFKIDADGTNTSALFEVFNQTWPEPHMVQPFLPSVAEGDKRIVLVDGEVAGAINRKPGEGEFRSNLAQGGSAEASQLTDREKEICAAMGPELKRRGLTFVGIDVIGGEWLTEINVTSPTGIVAIDNYNGTNTAGMIWDALERRHAEM